MRFKKVQFNYFLMFQKITFTTTFLRTSYLPFTAPPPSPGRLSAVWSCRNSWFRLCEAAGTADSD